jgi:hypothetical protein
MNYEFEFSKIVGIFSSIGRITEILRNEDGTTTLVLDKSVRLDEYDVVKMLGNSFFLEIKVHKDSLAIRYDIQFQDSFVIADF